MENKNYVLEVGRIVHLQNGRRGHASAVMLGVNTGRGRDGMGDSPFFQVNDPELKMKLKNELKMGDIAEIHGHFVTRITFEPVRGQNLFRKVFLKTLIADEIYLAEGRATNYAEFAGEIVRVYAKPDPGMYLITIAERTQGERQTVDFTYFDKDLELKPEVGDYVYAKGKVRTKKTEDTGKYLISVVADNVRLERKK